MLNDRLINAKINTSYLSTFPRDSFNFFFREFLTHYKENIKVNKQTFYPAGHGQALSLLKPTTPVIAPKYNEANGLITLYMKRMLEDLTGSYHLAEK